MASSLQPSKSATATPRRRLLPAALTTIAIAWGGYESFVQVPPSRDQPHGLHWRARYEALREPLAGVPEVIYLKATDVKGKFRFFRAQYILIPTTLVLQRQPDLFLSGRWPERPLIVDYRKARDLKPVLRQLRRRASELGIEVEIRDFGRGLALVERQTS